MPQIDEGLEKLHAEDEHAAKVVELRFFCGLEMSEVAEALQIGADGAPRVAVHADTLV